MAGMDFAIWMGLVDGCFVGTIRTNTNHLGALWKCKAWMDRRFVRTFRPIQTHPRPMEIHPYIAEYAWYMYHWDSL